MYLDEHVIGGCDDATASGVKRNTIGREIVMSRNLIQFAELAVNRKPTVLMGSHTPLSNALFEQSCAQQAMVDPHVGRRRQRVCLTANRSVWWRVCDGILQVMCRIDYLTL